MVQGQVSSAGEKKKKRKTSGTFSGIYLDGAVEKISSNS
jgi:hypothetical protein